MTLSQRIETFQNLLAGIRQYANSRKNPEWAGRDRSPRTCDGASLPNDFHRAYSPNSLLEVSTDLATVKAGRHSIQSVCRGSKNRRTSVSLPDYFSKCSKSRRRVPVVPQRTLKPGLALRPMLNCLSQGSPSGMSVRGHRVPQRRTYHAESFSEAAPK